jgi:hypothetical protein
MEDMLLNGEWYCIQSELFDDTTYPKEVRECLAASANQQKAQDKCVSDAFVLTNYGLHLANFEHLIRDHPVHVCDVCEQRFRKKSVSLRIERKYTMTVLQVFRCPKKWDKHKNAKVTEMIRRCLPNLSDGDEFQWCSGCRNSILYKVRLKFFIKFFFFENFL